jgi:hypothetical protein
MKSIFGAALVLVSFAVTITPSRAQSNSFWASESPLTTDDRLLIRQAEQAQIHGKRPGTVANWVNPKSGHSGMITLLGASTRQGLSCERIEYKIMKAASAKQHGRYVFTSCQLPDRSWKFAD